MATYELIETITLGSDAASVTFNAIPQNFTDLVIRGSARSTTNPFSEEWIFGTLGFNSDGSGVNQSGRHIVAGGGGGAVDSFSTAIRYYFTSSGATANTFGSFEIYITNYNILNTKSVSVSSNSENNGARNIIHVASGLWSGTDAITQLVFFPRQDSFSINSSFSLYGIKKA